MVNFNKDVPASNNNPSDDQPEMLLNNIGIEAIWRVDHVGFNDADSGKHVKITFNDQSSPGAPTDPVSLLYTTTGVASTVSDMRFRNQNAIFPVNLIRAYCSFNPTAGGLNINQSINIDTGAAGTLRNSAGSYSFVFNSNVVTGTDYLVFVSIHADIAATTGRYFYGITNYLAASFDLNVTDVNGVQSDPPQIGFAVMQL